MKVMKILIMFVLCFSLFACGGAEPDYPFVGKWAGLIQDEYSEVHITSEEIYSFGLNPLAISPISFTVKGDSLYYNTFEMTVMYQIKADSILVISNYDFSDTLYRMDNSIVTKDEINPSDTVILKEYYGAFNKRTAAFYRKLGYEDYWDYNEAEFYTVAEELMIITK